MAECKKLQMILTIASTPTKKNKRIPGILIKIPPHRECTGHIWHPIGIYYSNVSENFIRTSQDVKKSLYSVTDQINNHHSRNGIMNKNDRKLINCSAYTVYNAHIVASVL